MNPKKKGKSKISLWLEISFGKMIYATVYNWPIFVDRYLRIHKPCYELNLMWKINRNTNFLNTPPSLSFISTFV
jgi:hypothetical protein